MADVRKPARPKATLNDSDIDTRPRFGRRTTLALAGAAAAGAIGAATPANA